MVKDVIFEMMYYGDITSVLSECVFFTRTAATNKKMGNKEQLWDKSLSRNICPSSTDIIHMMCLEGDPYHV